MLKGVLKPTQTANKKHNKKQLYNSDATTVDDTVATASHRDALQMWHVPDDFDFYSEKNNVPIPQGEQLVPLPQKDQFAAASDLPASAAVTVVASAVVSAVTSKSNAVAVFFNKTTSINRKKNWC